MASKSNKPKKKSFFQTVALALGFVKQKVQILVIGLDNSGKSTLLNHLQPSKGGDIKEVAPTIGFSVETFSKDSLNFTCFDMSGQSKYRSLWEQYYSDVQAVIWVIDSTDKIRMCVVQDELRNLLEHKDVANVTFPILFCANKMDCATALSPVDLCAQLELTKIAGKPWHISATNALNGDGVSDGIDWLSDQLTKSVPRGK